MDLSRSARNLALLVLLTAPSACHARSQDTPTRHPLAFRGPLAVDAAWHPTSLSLCNALLDSASRTRLGAGVRRCVMRNAARIRSLDVAPDSTVLQSVTTWRVETGESDQLFTARADTLSHQFGPARKCGTDHLVWDRANGIRSSLVRWLPPVLHAAPGTWEVIELHTSRPIDRLFWCEVSATGRATE